MKLERIRNQSDFQRIREEWNNFLFSSDLNNIFSTHEWFSAWWRHLSDDSRMEFIIFRDIRGGICGMAPLRQKDNRLLFAASHEVTDYCDFITHFHTREEFYDSLLKCFHEDFPGVTVFEFINFKESSPSLTYIPKLAPDHGFFCTREELEVVPVLDLPETYEEYVNGLERKNRHELRRKLRRFEALEGLRSERLTEPAVLRTSIEAFIELHRTSSPEKQKFWQNSGMEGFFKEVLYQFAFKGWVELDLLFQNDALIASLISFLYLDEVLFYNVAYSAEYARFSPGLYLFHRFIQEAIATGKKQADFLRGREKYKYDFGAKEGKIYALTLTTGESAL